MKITKRQLRRIIREEKARILNEKTYVNTSHELRDRVRDERAALEVVAADIIGRLEIPSEDAVLNDGRPFEEQLFSMLKQMQVISAELEKLRKLSY